MVFDLRTQGLRLANAFGFRRKACDFRRKARDSGERPATQAKGLRLRRKACDSGERPATQAKGLRLRRKACDSGGLAYDRAQSFHDAFDLFGFDDQWRCHRDGIAGLAHHDAALEAL
jgi:hypothetical protein